MVKGTQVPRFQSRMFARVLRAVAAAIIGSTVITAHAEGQRAVATPLAFVPGRLLVQPRAGLEPRDFDAIIRPHGGRRLHTIPQINVHVIEVPPQAERAIAAALARHPQINFAELDRQVTRAFTPNDANYSNAWHLPKIGAPAAWDHTVGTGVTIAILDTGVDATHPDLIGNLVAGYNFYDNNSDTHDVQGHGTSTAGTAAMAGNNLIGSAGVAFTSRIMPIRISDTSGNGYLSMISSGIIWAADQGARVASISFGPLCDSQTVISAAQYMRSKGGVVVVAGGNSGVDEGLAPSDALTCVSATDANDVKTSWSSFGAYIDVAAPGLSIFTTANGGGYHAVSGTSFSTPMTAGVYALMMAANPQLAPTQLDAALFSTAVDLGDPGKDTLYGYGRINAAAAVAKVSTSAPVDTTAPAVSIASPSSGAQVSGLVNIDVTASDNVGVSRVDLYAGASLIASDFTAPYNFTWNTSGVANGTVTLQAKAFDAAGNVGTSQVNVSVAAATGETNFALASAGAVASASSVYSAAFPASALNDGQRSGANFGNGGGWADATASVFPDWVQINFSGTKSIDRVVVYSVQDNYTSPVEPTDTMTFSLYGLVDFTVQGWDGSNWVTLATVNGNNLVKRTVTFPPYITDRIRVNITNAPTAYSASTEIEAWGQ